MMAIFFFFFLTAAAAAAAAAAQGYSMIMSSVGGVEDTTMSPSA
jgi:hypothetical protein